MLDPMPSRPGLDPEFWLGHAGEHPTTLDVCFIEAGDGTRVRLEHGGYAAHVS